MFVCSMYTSTSSRLRSARVHRRPCAHSTHVTSSFSFLMFKKKKEKKILLSLDRTLRNVQLSIVIPREVTSVRSQRVPTEKNVKQQIMMTTTMMMRRMITAIIMTMILMVIMKGCAQDRIHCTFKVARCGKTGQFAL